MNILVSAYSCEPNKGSEPGLGWNWSAQIAKRGHHVYILTRTSNKASIEQQPAVDNISFLYYDLPSYLLHLKKYMGVQLYYMLWQIGVYFKVRTADKCFKFDLIHHVTFGVFRHVSYLAFIGKPFVFGPAGGGQQAPWALVKNYGLRVIFFEFVRNFLNLWSKFNPVLRAMYKRSQLICLTTEDTIPFIPKKYRHKVIITYGVGTDSTDRVIEKKPKDIYDFLFVGRLLQWKGVHLCIKAFALLLKERTDIRLTIVGKGEYSPELKRMQQELEINAIEWKGFVPDSELSDIYKKSDIFLFLSLHESSGMVIYESLSHGIPVVCLNIGGPPIVTGKEMNAIIDVDHQTEDEVIEAIVKKMGQMIANDDDLVMLKRAALERARLLEWGPVVDLVYEKIEKTIPLS